MSETEGPFGPNTPAVQALIERIKTMTPDEADALAAAWAAAWDAACDAACDAAWNAALNAAWDAALDAAREAALDAVWGAALDAALALVVRDLISPDHFEVLTRPWRDVIGPELVLGGDGS